MEICRCEEYRLAVENLTIFTIGTFQPLKETIPVPPNICFHWTKFRVGIEDLRFHKPIVNEKENDFPKSVKEPPNKWIPVLPGLLSQRLVNEGKTLKNVPY